MIYLSEDLREILPNDDVNKILNTIYEYHYEIIRNVDNRKTFKLSLNKKDYFVKHHNYLPLRKLIKETLKNFLNLKKPIFNAINEVKAINYLNYINVNTMTISGYGINSKNYFKTNSFIITESLEPAESLEHLDKILNKYTKQEKFKKKREIIKQVAQITKKLHDNYIIHQDYYLCHFLLKENLLFLIDLHRMQKVSKHFFKSKKMKELADLYYSSLNINSLSYFDIYYFLKCYYGKISLKAIFENDLKLKYRNKIESRAMKLNKKALRKKIFKDNNE